MSFSGETGDGPAVLQLQTWRQLQFQLTLSEFCEASISPSRELLLLLSHQREALLIPLTFGKGSASTLGDNDVTSRLQRDDVQGPSSLPISSLVQIPICRVDSLGNDLCATGPSDINSSVACKYPPAISSVKSFTWGHHGDGYNQFKGTGYREFLVVAGDNDITVHAFVYLDQNTKLVNPESDGVHVHGKWVEWGPTQLSHSDHLESVPEVNNISGTEGKEHTPRCKDPDSCNSSSTHRKWFRTYLTKLDTTLSDGKCLARFPSEASLPHSVEVVSFSIYDSLLTFLDFLSSPESCNMDQSQRTVPEQMGNKTTYDFPQRTPSHFGCKDADSGFPYKCSRVFSSSSQQLVGLVLSFSEKASINNEEDHQKASSETLVVVFSIHQWGMQWISAIDLHKRFSSSGPHPEWADFQFLENYLVCLNTSGFICIWYADTGDFVAHLDVLKSFALDMKICYNRQTTSPNRDSAPEFGSFDEETDQRNRDDGTATSSQSLARARTFRRIMVASHSMLLAIVDDNGVIFIISAYEYISEKQHTFNKIVYPLDLGTMATWKIAGQGTVRRLVFPDLLCRQGLPVPNFSNDVSSERNHITDSSFWRKQFTEYKESRHAAHSSGSIAVPQNNSWKSPESESEISSVPMRRIFLPPHRFDIEDFISFSFFGVTRVIKCSNLNGQKGYKIVHTDLHVAPSVLSDADVNTCWLSKQFSTKESAFVGESLGFSFQGCLYLVTQDGLSVILPSVSASSGDSTRYWKPTAVGSVGINVPKGPQMPWQIEILDKTLLFEGLEEAENVSLKNGWDLRFARVRQLQLALHYLKSEEIEKSLNTLVDVNLAEEGILRLLFTSVYQYSCKVGGDNEVALASRLLALASSFAIKMVRRYGLIEHKNDKFMDSAKMDTIVTRALSVSRKHSAGKVGNSRRLQEMAHFLEVIRNLQSRLATRNRRLGQGEISDALSDTSMVDTHVSQAESFPLVTMITTPSGASEAFQGQSKEELALTAPDSEYSSTDSLALSSTRSSVNAMNLHEFDAHDAGYFQRRNLAFLENARDMMARWEMDNLDFKSIVKDALQSGRLPLAVLQLHLQHKKESASEKGYDDIFNEVRENGRAICYDLFLKGESALALATLQKLGEDIETILRQLVFGTVRRSLRANILVEMRKYGWLGPHEWNIFERISVFERLYPSSSFWKTFLAKQNTLSEDVSLLNSPEESNLKVGILLSDNLAVECDDIDGVVGDGWESVIRVSAHTTDSEDSAQIGYWACAAAWSDAWDQRTMDRIVLDQHSHMGVHVPWESQLEYHMSHNEIEEVYRLFDVIPSYLLVEGTLKVNLFSSHSSGNIGTSMKFPDCTMYYAAEELEPVFMDIPNVRIFRSSAVNSCSSWVKLLVEQELAKKYIFIKEYWDSTAEIMPLLAHARLIIDTSRVSIETEPSNPSLDLDTFRSEQSHKDTQAAIHILVLRHCIHHNLPNLLDLYLDHHNMVLDDNSLSSLVEATGDCQWAKWLLYTRIKSREYDASFSNARSNLSRQMIPGSNLGVLEIDEIISTVDDMAEGGGEMAALATLMYASIPIQQCLCSGSVNKHCNSSSQCTIENLRPGLQKFPTLWRALVAACFSQDADGHSFGSSTVSARFSFSNYVSWRHNIFSSSVGDTSLIQMLPCWLPKSIRRLIKLSVQGPLGWQSLSDEEHKGGSFLYKDKTYASNATGDGESHAIKWEKAIQTSVEKLYSSVKEKGFGVEHHLHRGRALAALNHFLGLRAQRLKSIATHQLLSGHNNLQSDVQKMLSPLRQSEGSFLSSVMPLAIMNFEDSILVASCAFLLELCGLSASMLRVDIAALRRISSYYKLIEENIAREGTPLHSVTHESDFTASLARALADDHVQHDHLQNLEIKDTADKDLTSKQQSRSLISVVHHLENASLPLMDGGGTCGLWLSSGNGDGLEYRTQQRDASQHWSLVTAFCQMHRLPLSTRYLALLANDNDWVGFLTEAQFVGFPIDVVIQVATQEFRDPRLKTHILTVLKSMQSTRRKTVSSPNTSSAGRSFEVPFVTNDTTAVPTELFGILAHCERQKNPGESLLVKAKDLRWSLLAVIASCFSDVSPLSCLSVWLEITAARETSSIKVNDITSKIASGVGAAVEATNLLLSGARTPTFHYHRKNPKRKRIMEPSSGNRMADGASSFPNSPSSMIASFAQEMSSEEEKIKLPFVQSSTSSESDGGLASLSNMVSVLCEQQLFLPLLRAFEMFMPSCSLLPFIRSLQAFSQMRLSEASAHLASFSARIREEPFLIQVSTGKDEKIKTAWTSSTAVKAADAVLLTCPSAYEKRCLLQLLSAADFGDGGFASTYFRRLHWKINLAEPSLRKDADAYLGNEALDDASLLSALERNGQWEQARNWARQLESSGASWKSAVHHVTETQAEAMVTEWKEFLWDMPEERVALWNHCQTLFLRYSFPALQAGLFFLKHAEAIEKEIPPKELHELLSLSLQWLSGTMTRTTPVYPLHLLREIETRVWLLAVESEVHSKNDGSFTTTNFVQNIGDGSSNSVIEQTANIVTKMDGHLNSVRMRVTERNGTRENNFSHHRHFQVSDSNSPVSVGGNMRMKRRAKNVMPLRRPIVDNADGHTDSDDCPSSPTNRNSGELSRNQQLHEDSLKIEASLSGWEERVRPADLERAVLSLLEFGQMSAAKQLQQKLSPAHVPSELIIVDAALKVAALSSSSGSGEISETTLDSEVRSLILSLNISISNHMIDTFQVLESLAEKCGEGCGHGLCRRIIAVTKAARVLGLSFTEAFEKRPLELLQLLSLKAQDSLEEAKLMVQTHVIPPSSMSRVLAESFLKGLLAAHRGGYMDSQNEEGPAPLLWRYKDFLKWAELCPSEPEIGHALMRLVMTGQDIPHACEVELLILSHHFYKSSACLDGVDVLVTLAANRVELYVSEGDFSCLARLITGVSNFHALNFILNILIENGQLELLLRKYSAAEAEAGTTDARGFRMAVLTSLTLFNPHDVDAFAMVYDHFDMRQEKSSFLESLSTMHMQQWFSRWDRDRQNEDLLESMRHLIEAAEVVSTIDVGHKTRRICARAYLFSLQIRIPDFIWLELSETNARRVLVEQSRFQEALIVAEAYNLNQPGEWALVLWNLMLKPDLIEQFAAEFVSVLPLQSSMLLDLAKFYKSEVAARGDQSHFSVWLSPGGLPAEWVKHLGRSFRSLLRRTSDLRLRLQLATIATGFADVTNACTKVLDKVPENAGPLILRRGHGGAYLPLM